ncbi:MAG: hypothetical protein JXC36_09315 [Candidatus Atribacteria bacterium]|nr:hypothetical protein [Candidatus Atribacteria bacterium]
MENTSIQLSEPISDYSETTASWAVRYIHPTGFQCILTLQATSGAEALKKAEGALSYLVNAECIPVRRDSRNDNEKNNGKGSSRTVLVKTDGKNPVCPIHNIEMHKYTKNGRVWFSHRWNSGWCSGEEKKS